VLCCSVAAFSLRTWTKCLFLALRCAAGRMKRQLHGHLENLYEPPDACNFRHICVIACATSCILCMLFPMLCCCCRGTEVPQL
jgi:hypothetical protein